MAIHGFVFTVDPEYAEEMLAEHQHRMYMAVIDAIKPTYAASYKLWTDHMQAMKEMEEMSDILCRAAARYGDASLKPFVAGTLSTPPPASLDYELHDIQPQPS
eukprot:scaffold237303_cov35-Prasinocladus_malaysianus.AAC.2